MYGIFIFWGCWAISAKDKENLLNEEITAKEVRLIGADGETLGIMSASKALEMAYDQGMDLVMMASQANPPVCKIMDYGKFRFERDKREKEAKKKQQTIELKEIQLSYRIETHDFETKVKHALRFLGDGNKVRVVMQMGAIGAEMLSGKATTSASKAYNAFNGQVDVAATAVNSVANMGFKVTFTGLGKEACVALSTADWGSGSGSGLVSVAAGTGAGDYFKNTLSKLKEQ